MLYKVDLSYKLLLVILGMSLNYVSGSNANLNNVNSNGNADGNNNVNNSNGVPSRFLLI